MIRRICNSADPDEPSELGAFDRDLRARIRSGFDPPPGTVARVERQVVSAFQAAVERLPPVASEPAPARQTAVATRFRASPRWRVLVLAAALAVMTTSVTMAAQTSPGRPLFGARLALESVLLPGRAAPSRIDAQLARLARRVAEVTDAVRDGDGGAAAAAARAYRETLDDLPGLVRQHPERAVGVRRALGDQLHALEGLVDRTSGEAGEAVIEAIHAARAVRRGLPGPAAGPGYWSMVRPAWRESAHRSGCQRLASRRRTAGLAAARPVWLPAGRSGCQPAGILVNASVPSSTERPDPVRGLGPAGGALGPAGGGLGPAGGAL